jgi:hypothetical protein
MPVQLALSIGVEISARIRPQSVIVVAMAAVKQSIAVDCFTATPRSAPVVRGSIDYNAGRDALLLFT